MENLNLLILFFSFWYLEKNKLVIYYLKQSALSIFIFA